MTMQIRGYYTGVGSRQTPADKLELAQQLAQRLSDEGWVVRSGGAEGADTAFERGARSACRRVYLPWAGFNGRHHNDCVVPSRMLREVYPRAVEIASAHHPFWHGLKDPVRKLMVRNVFQVLGDDLNSPSRFLWCWASGASMEHGAIVDVPGGTGLAVRVAARFGVPVYHLGLVDHLKVLKDYLDRPAAEAGKSLKF